jgi:hypothetical protein
MEHIGQFVGKPTARRVINEGFDGRDEGTEAGKPNRIVGPQTSIVEAGSFAEGIVTTAMSITGEVIEQLEFAKDGEVGTGAESCLQLRQGGDFVPQEVLAESLGVERGWAHNVIVPTRRPI